MAERMATWVVWAVINSHRRMEYFLQRQARAEWPERFPIPDNRDVAVVVLGSGGMGGAAAAALHALGASPPRLPHLGAVDLGRGLLPTWMWLSQAPAACPCKALSGGIQITGSVWPLRLTV